MRMRIVNVLLTDNHCVCVYRKCIVLYVQ